MLTKIALITTTRCDLKCQHCLRGFPEERPDFPIELLDKLLIEAMPFGLKHVGLTGGEPHLHPQFGEIVEKIISYGYTWHFVSNGLQTKPYLPVIEKFKDKFSHTTISIDGVEAKTHDSIRNRKGAFKKARSSIRKYVQRGYRVKVNTTLSQTNKDDLEKFITLATELGAEELNFGGIIPTPWNRNLALNDLDSLKLYQKIVDLRKNAEIKIHTTSSLHTRGGIDFCDVFSLRGVTINARGDMVFCCDTIKEGAVIGSLHEHPFVSLIERWIEKSGELKRQRARQIANGDMEEGFDSCSFCNHYFSLNAIDPS